MQSVTKKVGNEGFTLVELMVAAFILSIAIIGILLGYVKCLDLNEMSRNSTIAVAATKSQMEQIKNTAFNQIFANFDDATFTSAGINGIGVTYVDNTNPTLLQITVSFCWQQKNGQVIGEDSNLDGNLDVGEDTNGNGIVDSPVQIVTNMFGG
ncbi:MAG: prepilin-type N-terminal cleavage/methylation domain-containing protein [Candidatus Omnitrophica bacterium]|nr:prepilin-type N-terminal cleavage/methylation domain-containing protein [Candidatus Omnitrophota bacterium]